MKKELATTPRCEGETTLGMLIKTGYIFVILLLNFVKKTTCIGKAHTV